MSKEELLLAQVRIYLMLARSLKSQFYLMRAQKTLALFLKECENKTAIMNIAA